MSTPTRPAKGERHELHNVLPCPFCGSPRIIKGERYFAMCVDCGATGPERNSDATERKFTADWNSRATRPTGHSEV